MVIVSLKKTFINLERRKGNFIFYKGLQSVRWPFCRLVSVSPEETRDRHFEGGGFGGRSFMLKGLTKHI